MRCPTATVMGLVEAGLGISVVPTLTLYQFRRDTIVTRALPLPALRRRMLPDTTLSGRANLFVFPNIDAANITYNMIRVMTGGAALGPILMGVNKPAHILTPSATPRRVINMTAIAAVDAQIRKAQLEG